MRYRVALARDSLATLEGIRVQQSDVERIARAALKDLGVPRPDLVIEPDGKPDQWRIHVRGNTQGPTMLKVKCGAGSSPQWVREQIFEQYTR